jgi:Asp-tRNA(Asn)/Glu-tRNA(Gln) amidotransferase A subunit family amidase
MSIAANSLQPAKAYQAERLDPFGAYVARRNVGEAFHGRLRGLRIAVKDNISVKGLPYTAGLRCFSDRVGKADAAIVALLRSAGGRVNGVTETDAGGLGVLTPKVKNPVLPGHTVGGSSGGSAAAVAAGLADVGIGTDTGGSVRIPAACCGIFGFKASGNRISTDGIWPLAPMFDSIGVMADDRLVLKSVVETLLGEPPLSARGAGIRLGLDLNRLRACDPTVAATVENVCRALRADIFSICPIDLPSRRTVTKAHATMVLFEALKLYEPIWRATPKFLPETVLKALEAAERLTDADIANAASSLSDVRAQMAKLLTDVDAIVVPTLPFLPPMANQDRMRIDGIEVPAAVAMTSETSLANIVGGPAFSIPCGPGDARFVGLQLIGLRGYDAKILSIGDEIASVTAGLDAQFSHPKASSI